MNIAVLVSGGVDSSVALRLLLEQGHTVTAFYLKIWLEDELSYLGDCPWQEDVSYVQKVCEQVGVPLEIVPLQKEYQEQIVTYTLQEVKAGRTPNPDVLCNKRIKFGMFMQYLDNLEGKTFDKIATGHYAQVKRDGDLYQLSCAPDPIKDQTYFLSYLNQEQLSRIVFPIGHLAKNEVRTLAQSFDLSNKERKDSQGICFLGKLKFSDFIKHYLGEKPGDLIEHETGQKYGEHKGFWFYTIGQRHGIGLAGGPWYVVAKDVERNIIFISKNYYSQEKERTTFLVADCNWIAQHAPEQKNVRVKLRHGVQFHECELVQVADGTMQVTLQERDQGIASGQFAVFYDSNVCLGSGIIT